MEAHTDGITQVRFSPQGDILASGSRDGTIKLWSVNDGALLHTLQGHTGWVKSLDFSPNGELLASGSEDGTVRLWGIDQK
ncbi:MAG: hypothetical protein HC875_32080 [Anaerolineales bacterium]|nr:hypothetical protein [Anaerolineales bacterium]